MEREGFLIAGARSLMVGTRVGNVAKAFDAVGLAEEIVNTAREGEGSLIVRARSLMVGTCESNVTEAVDAVRLTDDSATRR